MEEHGQKACQFGPDAMRFDKQIALHCCLPSLKASSCPPITLDCPLTLNAFAQLTQGQPAVDFMVRYEHLEEDLNKAVAEMWAIFHAQIPHAHFLHDLLCTLLQPHPAHFYHPGQQLAILIQLVCMLPWQPLSSLSVPSLFTVSFCFHMQMHPLLCCITPCPPARSRH